MTREWLTVAEVVTLFGIERTAVYRRLRTPEWAPFVAKVGSYRVNRLGLEGWLATGGDLCPTTSEDTRIRSIGTLASPTQTELGRTGKARAKSEKVTPVSLPSNGTRLRLRVIESSRSQKRTGT